MTDAGYNQQAQQQQQQQWSVNSADPRQQQQWMAYWQVNFNENQKYNGK